jgi:hypothetical protein
MSDRQSLGSLGPRARELDHLGPLLGFFDDEHSEIGRRAAEHRGAQIGKPRLYFGVRENGIELVIEAADHLCGRILAQAYGEPLACRVVRHKFVDCRDIRQRFERVGVVTASTRSLPARMCSITKLKLPK